MLISPEYAIEQQWITHPLCESIDDWRENKYLNPNAIDFTLDHLYVPRDFDSDGSRFSLYPNGKSFIERDERVPTAVACNSDGTYSGWTIAGKSYVECLSDMYVNVPEGVAALLRIRSTLARNGLVLQSGLYDSGFSGHVGCVLHNLHSNDAFIAYQSRIGQIMFVKSDSVGLYEGGYNHEQGSSLEYH